MPADGRLPRDRDDQSSHPPALGNVSRDVREIRRQGGQAHRGAFQRRFSARRGMSQIFCFQPHDFVFQDALVAGLYDPKALLFNRNSCFALLVAQIVGVGAPDLVLPFAALPENGRDISRIDQQ